MFIQRIAKTDIKKAKLPKVKDIINAKKKKIYDELASILEEDKVDAEYYNWAKSLLENNNPTEILATILNYCFEDELNPDAYGEIKEVRSKGRQSDHRGQLDNHGKARLFVALGKKDKLSPKKLINLITGRIHIRPRKINDIQIMEKFSFVTLPFDKAEKIVDSFKKRGERPIFTHANKK
jgi:ATP-dependent RNA helicase DeaD